MNVTEYVEGDWKLFPHVGVQPGGLGLEDWGDGSGVVWSGALNGVDVAYGEVGHWRPHGLEGCRDVLDVHAVEKDTVVGLDVSVPAELQLDVIDTLVAKRFDEDNAGEFRVRRHL